MSKPRRPYLPARSTPVASAQHQRQLNEAVALFGTITDALARHTSISLQAQDRRQPMLADYVFGMLLAYGQRESLPPPAVMGAMNMLLITKFGASIQQADQQTRELVAATGPGHDRVRHTTIYRGIAGLPRWTADEPEAVAADFAACLADLETGSIP